MSDDRNRYSFQSVFQTSLKMVDIVWNNSPVYGEWTIGFLTTESQV